MGNQAKIAKKDIINLNADAANGADGQDAFVEVLYQKMGDRWFAFSLVGEEVFVGSISEEALAAQQALEMNKNEII